MSALEFHFGINSLDYVPINGSEHHQSVHRDQEKFLRQIARYPDVLRKIGWDGNYLEMWVSSLLGRGEFQWDGETYPVMQLMLNSRAKDGTDMEAVMTRLNGSVDDGVWIAASDTDWLAAIIEKDLQVGWICQDDRWAMVARRLWETTDDVVINFSVTDAFQTVITEEYMEGGECRDRKIELTWDEALQQVKDRGWWLQLTPENLHAAMYSPCITFDDVLERFQ